MDMIPHAPDMISWHDDPHREDVEWCIIFDCGEHAQLNPAGDASSAENAPQSGSSVECRVRIRKDPTHDFRFDSGQEPMHLGAPNQRTIAVGPVLQTTLQSIP
jgi:hypothetical protein